jgi:2-(1,2-epoxy-1,2-dihydrophenyl)acetyl-CoA isomerase
VTERAQDDLLRQVDGGVCRITLNRPDAGNALTPAMRDQIPVWMEEASADPSVRVVVVAGTGERGFCTGADLRAGRSQQAREPLRSGTEPGGPEGAPERMVGDVARMITRGWQRLVCSILDCEKPVIAAVNATAAGGGMHLALACDLVIAAEEARFIEVFVRRGIIPDAGGFYLLARLIGPQRAKELTFFGDDLPAPEAERLGLVNRVVPRSELDKTVAEWAERLAASPTRVIAFAKRLTNRALESDRDTALWEEAHAQEIVNATEDAKEGMTAFAERRAARFKGW